MPRTLLIPTDLIITAKELLQSVLKPGTANNDDNVVTDWNLQDMEWEYLTSTTAWFLQSDKHDINWFWRFAPSTGMEEDFKTDDILRKLRQGYAYGFGEWRGNYGTDGVA